jgi:hypothetical protein
MRKIVALLTTLFILNGAFASAIIINPPLKASEIFFPVGNSGKMISLLDLSQIKVKDFEMLADKKMKFAERLAFKVAQSRLRNSINHDGTFNKKKIQRLLTKKVDGEGGFSLGGFALGLLLGPIGVLLAYLSKGDRKRSLVTWAWVGFGLVVVFYAWLYSGFL